MTIDYRGTTALITGASSGLGEQFARQLAARGADLVLVARRRERLQTLAEELRTGHGVSVDVIATDLAAPGAVPALVQTLTEREHVIGTLINNAGFATRARFENDDADRVHEQVQLNVATLVDLTRALYPALLASGRGALVSIASTAAYQPTPAMAVYGATKAFVLSFTEALWYEARGSGLRVLAVSPGATRTEFFDVAGENARVGAFREPSDVVAHALSTLDRRNPPPSIIDGAANRITAVLPRLLTRRAGVSLTGWVTGRRPIDAAH